MAKENMYGTMHPHMMDNGLKTRSMDSVFTNGLMVDDMKENGKTTTCMGKVFTHGKMVGSTKEITSMIGSMDLDLIHGKMEGSTLVSGLMASNTVKEPTGKPMVRKEEAFGKMARESDGLMNEYPC